MDKEKVDFCSFVSASAPHHVTTPPTASPTACSAQASSTAASLSLQPAGPAVAPHAKMPDSAPPQDSPRPQFPKKRKSWQSRKSYRSPHQSDSHAAPACPPSTPESTQCPATRDCRPAESSPIPPPPAHKAERCWKVPRPAPAPPQSDRRAKPHLNGN